jgi:hypothetical protein
MTKYSLDEWYDENFERDFDDDDFDLAATEQDAAEITRHDGDSRARRERAGWTAGLAARQERLARSLLYPRSGRVTVEGGAGSLEGDRQPPVGSSHQRRPEPPAASRKEQRP